MLMPAIYARYRGHIIEVPNLMLHGDDDTPRLGDIQLIALYSVANVNASMLIRHQSIRGLQLARDVTQDLKQSSPPRDSRTREATW